MPIVLDGTTGINNPAGSASAPSLSPAGDTNTGIFFPAADTIAFAEGGVEAMRIDASGNVIIGTTTNYSSRLALIPSTTPTTVVNGNQLQIGESTSNTAYRLQVGYINDATAGYIGSIQAYSGGTATNLTINSDGGNLGIGTVSPRSKLESISGSANTNADIAGTAGAFIGATGSGQSSIVSIESNDTIAANTGGVLGFGGRWLGTQYANWASIKGLKDTATSGEYGGYLSFFTRANGASSLERMRITSSGNLQFNSGYGSVATAYGCRAWVNFNGTGTVAIRGSGNVSSITDNGVGQYRVNFTTAMPDVNYSTTATSHENTSGSGSLSLTQNSTVLTGSVGILTTTPTTLSLADSLSVNVSIFR